MAYDRPSSAAAAAVAAVAAAAAADAETRRVFCCGRRTGGRIGGRQYLRHVFMTQTRDSCNFRLAPPRLPEA